MPCFSFWGQDTQRLEHATALNSRCVFDKTGRHEDDEHAEEDVNSDEDENSDEDGNDHSDEDRDVPFQSLPRRNDDDDDGDTGEDEFSDESESDNSMWD